MPCNRVPPRGADVELVEILRQAMAENVSRRTSLAELIILDCKDSIVEVEVAAVVSHLPLFLPSVPLALPRAPQLDHDGRETTRKEEIRVRKGS